MQPLEPIDPRQVGNYTLLGRLGGGGMGQVYLGRSPGGRPVAVKVVHGVLASDSGFRRRFAQEVEAARRVGGFHTAPVVDADPDGDPPWLVTAYVPGPSLHDAVAQLGPLAIPTVRSLGAGLAEGLAAIHACGLVHRDLKPANVILADDGPRVIDFGIARAMGGAAELTQTGTVVGTPGFMSPEQAMGETDIGPSSDVFSLGSVLAFAVTGQGPFGAGSIAGIVYRIVSGQADLSRVPDELRDVVEACLTPEPSLRPSLDEVTDALARGQESTDMFTPGWLPATVPALATVAIEAMTGPVPVPSPTRAAVPPPPVPGSVPVAVEPDGPTELLAPRDTKEPGSPSGPSRRRLLFGAVGVVAAAAVGATAWALVGGGDGDKNPGGAGESDAPLSGGKLRWRFATAGTVLSYPRVAGEQVHAASNDGTLYAVNTSNGTETWRFTTGAALGSAPAVVGGTAYLGSDDTHLYAVDAATGAERWAFQTGGIVHSPVFSGGVAYVASADGKLYAINADGSKRWELVIGNDTHHVVISADTLYVGSSDNNLYAVDATKGEKRWAALTGGAVSGFPAVAGGTVYCTSTDNVLYAFDAATGAPRWKVPGISHKAGPTINGDSIYISNGSTVAELAAADGSERGRFGAAGDLGVPVTAGGKLYVGSTDQQLRCFDLTTRAELWRYSTAGAVQTPTVTADAVYVGAGDNTLYSVSV